MQGNQSLLISLFATLLFCSNNGYGSDTRQFVIKKSINISKQVDSNFMAAEQLTDDNSVERCRVSLEKGVYRYMLLNDGDEIVVNSSDSKKKKVSLVTNGLEQWALDTEVSSNEYVDYVYRAKYKGKWRTLLTIVRLKYGAHARASFRFLTVLDSGEIIAQQEWSLKIFEDERWAGDIEDIKFIEWQNRLYYVAITKNKRLYLFDEYGSHLKVITTSGNNSDIQIGEITSGGKIYLVVHLNKRPTAFSSEILFIDKDYSTVYHEVLPPTRRFGVVTSEKDPQVVLVTIGFKEINPEVWRYSIATSSD